MCIKTGPVSVIISPLMDAEEIIPNMVISKARMGGYGKISLESYFQCRGYSFWSDVGLVNEKVSNSNLKKQLSGLQPIADMRKDAKGIRA